MTGPHPNPVPIGTDHYYRDRLADFGERRPAASPPEYYADFGDKCLHQFRQTEPELTPLGREWLQSTLVDLQRRMEERREQDPVDFGRLELDSDEFAKMAFEMHSDAYLASGIAELPVADLRRIAATPDVADLITPEGLAEIGEVIGGVASERTIAPLRRLLRSIVDRVLRRRRR